MRLLTFSLQKQRFNANNSLEMELLTFINNIFLVGLSFAKYLQQCCSLFILTIALNRDFIELVVSRKHFLKVLYFLKNHSLTQNTMLMEYTAVDFPGKALRFELILLLLSPSWNFRIKLRLFSNELLALSTVTSFFKVAFWLERELWDMFGIMFQNHMDLRRILTDYGFLGHPLRKDFPLTGFFEIFFDDFRRNIITAPVSLAQEYRFYRMRNPWVRV